MRQSRRTFLKTGSAASLAFASLPLLASGAHAYSANAGRKLVADPNGIIDLPEGFSYRMVAQSGGVMSDGFIRPARPDGMACFAMPGDAGKCVLVRNHENFPDMRAGGPFGDDYALLEQLPEGKLYDRREDGSPYAGGTTTTIYDLANDRIEQEFLSLAGTAGNCAGGATPWGSWLSCEETDVDVAGGARKSHGWVFEVPAAARDPVNPVPLTGLGRFVHEAAAIDPRTDIVYQTEDELSGLFYRFLPAQRRELQAGGRLQALAIRGWDSADVRNWPLDWSGENARKVEQGQTFETRWIDMEDTDAPEADMRERGAAAGAAVFCRGEGMGYGHDGSTGSIYFNCTQGGHARAGQVWRYTPSPNEGHTDEKDAPGTLTLVYESPTADTLDLIDNLAYTPWGDLMLCEDGFGDQYLRGLTPDGKIYDFARNAHEERAEFCGACFSPDGSVMFVNIQTPGFTLAIRGPWASLRG